MIWLNGALLAESVARIDPTDRGFTLGDGLFETIRIASGQAAHLGRHLMRLRDSAAFLSIPLKWTDAVLRDAIADLLAAQAVVDGVLRLTLTRGAAARGLLPGGTVAPTLLMQTGALPPAAKPARLIIARTTRRNEWSPTCRLKSTNYLDSILARQEAIERDADDALLLNTAGRLSEATIANLFVRIGGRLLTPPVADGALPGIARSLLLERADAEEALLKIDDLWRSDAAFLSNSLGLRPIVKIDGRPIGAERNPSWLANLIQSLQPD